ncbi:inactive protein kinase isoform X1 [Prunus yedoensis var. nudiflora]|uniref:non-specific serine/threonine protein kinase n=1 Tax=Prunus yedoensis var. nudiflora TaxID=2094558 RepID=A0A314UW71_PRUYE|nr:inactive protein kinase isoform X1 [Prunus yedoensis var. nudiflora]
MVGLGEGGTNSRMGGADKVIVAVKAEKVISKTALAWALTHVVHPGDCVTLLAVFSAVKTGSKFWNFPRFTGDCSSSRREDLPDRICQISESCSQMVLQFHSQIQVTVRIKVVLSTPGGAVASEARCNGANWVVLDKKLKQERKHCMEELGCNIVVMNGSQPKVLRLNLACQDELQTPFFSAASSPGTHVGKLQGLSRMKHSTPVSSPEEPSTSYTRTTGEGSSSSYDTVTSLFLVYEQNPLFEGPQRGNHRRNYSEDPYEELETIGERLITLSKPQPSSVVTTQSVFWIPQNHIVDHGNPPTPQNCNNAHKVRSPTFQTLFDEYAQFDQDTRKDKHGPNDTHHKSYLINSSIRDAVSLGRISSVPPPLCSLCQHKTPVFGKPPKQFSYKELEEATDAFSDMNFLAEGGFGVVHKGVLRDGQIVAVKQLKFGGSQADADFCREVRVLSCAQHRNVVLLIGYCIEGKARVLVYEYICNSSLDFHLHVNRTSLDCESRLKIATGAARGLRYLHEDCRVGCIVHRDLRPNNILLTHDFEPLVADFGLARLYSEWEMSNEDRVIGTSGYLAPEYVDGGQITHKVDVYAFGVVLLELMTGRRISELQYVKGHHILEEWFHPLATLEPNHIFSNSYQLLDPNLASLENLDLPHQLQTMARAASLCLCRDPESRPPMSKVLRVLEGGDPVVPLGLNLNSVGSRSGHLNGLRSQRQPEARGSHSRTLSH